MIFGILIWVGIIAVMVWIIIKYSKQGLTQGIKPDRTPLEIIKERYAGGEITKKQFEVLKNDIYGMPKVKTLSKMKKEINKR